MKDMKAVVGIFRVRDKAEQALTALQSIGLTSTHLRLVTLEASSSSEEMTTEVETPSHKTRTALSALMGGTIGISGSLIGAAVGSFFVAGSAPLAAIGLTLATLGGVTGAGVGMCAAETLEFSLLPPADLALYEEALKQRDVLIIVLADDHTQAERYRRILAEAGAEDLKGRREQWWSELRHPHEMIDESSSSQFHEV